MRLKLGRPDINRYAGRFDLHEAAADAPLSVSWLGVSTLLVDDGSTALLTDGFFSRPALLDVGLRRLSPSPDRIDDSLSRAGITNLAAVVPVHTHYDHAMDSALVARRTGAMLIGGQSAANIARGQGLSEDRILVATPGTEIELGSFTLTLIESHHCPPDRFPGTIDEPLVSPAKASAYRCGETWSTLVHHKPSGHRLLVQGSAGFIGGALAGHRAELAYLGIGQLGLQSVGYIERYWDETVRAVGARRVVLIHWDDFFRPLTEPIRALPYTGDDLDTTMTVLARLAERDGVSLHLPTVWQPIDPWA